MRCMYACARLACTICTCGAACCFVVFLLLLFCLCCRGCCCRCLSRYYHVSQWDFPPTPFSGASWHFPFSPRYRYGLAGDVCYHACLGSSERALLFFCSTGLPPFDSSPYKHLSQRQAALPLYLTSLEHVLRDASRDCAHAPDRLRTGYLNTTALCIRQGPIGSSRVLGTWCLDPSIHMYGVQAAPIRALYQEVLIKLSSSAAPSLSCEERNLPRNVLRAVSHLRSAAFC